MPFRIYTTSDSPDGSGRPVVTGPYLHIRLGRRSALVSSVLVVMLMLAVLLPDGRHQRVVRTVRLEHSRGQARSPLLSEPARSFVQGPSAPDG